MTTKTEAYFGANRPIIGKDVLELLSTAMYVDPLTIYREYVQNSADAIDAARANGLLSQSGKIEITIDPTSRTIRILDNGAGISAAAFPSTLTAIGASNKRGTGARGFRGVGRLSGLAYARELTFRSTAPGETLATSITWDCRALRTLLRDLDDRRELADIISEITTITFSADIPAEEHFFEVTLTGVGRIGDDRLLSPDAVAHYLSQVAPISFAPEFGLGDDIDLRLRGALVSNRLDIRVNEGQPLSRPFRDEIPVSGGRPLRLHAVRFVEVPSVDGGQAAIAWVAHHDYEGAINSSTRVRGLRARIGDIQVGEANVFENIFPESRFNAWTVGEVHIIDPRIVPNGRRDDFERNVHLANLKNHLAPLGREIAAKCRSSSAERKRLRDFASARDAALEHIAIIEQGSLSREAREHLALSVDLILLKMEKLSNSDTPLAGDRAEETDIAGIRCRLNDLLETNPPSSPLARLPADRRAFYEEMFRLIYECSSNRAAAKALVDRILEKIRIPG
jgi:molecular chaperone HtpG